MRRTERDSRSRALRSVGVALWSALLLVTAVAMSRRLAGAFAGELPMAATLPSLIVAALVSLIACELVRAGADPAQPMPREERTFVDRWRNGVPLVLTLLPVVLLGTVLLPASHAGGVPALLVLCGLTAAASLSSGMPLTGSSDRASAVAKFNRPAGRSDASVVNPFESRPPRSGGKLPAATESRPTLQANERTPSNPQLLPPLPLGAPLEAGRGEGERWTSAESSNSARLGVPPHPDPLPKGEGTGADAATSGDGFDDALDWDEVAGAVDPTRFSQWFTRGREPSGEERIEGHVTVTFAREQRLAMAHIPFHPPLAGTPEIDCEPLDGCDVRLRVAAVHTYGARIEAKRTNSLKAEESVQIGFVAVGAVPRSRAA